LSRLAATLVHDLEESEKEYGNQTIEMVRDRSAARFDRALAIFG